MSNQTFSRRLQQLIEQLRDHPHREEILKLASEQVVDDSTLVRHDSI